jgi:hypothetical protein
MGIRAACPQDIYTFAAEQRNGIRLSTVALQRSIYYLLNIYEMNGLSHQLYQRPKLALTKANFHSQKQAYRLCSIISGEIKKTVVTSIQDISASKGLSLFHLSYVRRELLPDYMCCNLSNNQRARKVSCYYWRPCHRYGGCGGYNHP